MIDYRVKKETPCRRCEDRTAECHSKCEKYKEWLVLLEEEKELFWKNEGATCAFRSMAGDRKAKQVKTRIRSKR